MEYRLLKGAEIRLLRVALGAWDDQVSCTKHYVDLDERPEYIALSYTWGDPNDQVDILLDGRRHRATRNLFTALRRFRKLCAEGRAHDGFTFSSSAGETTYIWVDALCINQADDREKEREIPRMRDVYTLCSRVYVWLGENDDSWEDDAKTKAMLEDMERWLASCSFGRDIPPDVVAIGMADSLPMRQEAEDHFGDRTAMFLDLWCELGRRDWFWRVWVIQEVALPEAEPILVAGGYLFGFERLTRPWAVIANMIIIRLMSTEVPQLVAHGALFRSRVQAQAYLLQTERELVDQRVRFGRAFMKAMGRRGPSEFQATVPHDYLYSMIGLCGGSGLLPPELAPDYRKSFPRVCEDYARCVIKATGSVAVLGRRRNKLWRDYNEALAENVPFWVPDFRKYQMTISVDGDMESSNVSFVGPDKRWLKVRGFDVGKVTKVLLPLQYYEDYETPEYEGASFSEYLRHHHKFLEAVARERNISTEDAVANWLHSRFLLSTNRFWTTLPALEDLQAVYNFYLQHDEEDDEEENNGLRALSLQDSYIAEGFVEAALGSLKQTCLLLKGGMDVVKGHEDRDDEIRRGDRVVALSGCKHPFLVKPLLTDEGTVYALKHFCIPYDGEEVVVYKTHDFSLEFYENSDFEDFILV